MTRPDNSTSHTLLSFVQILLDTCDVFKTLSSVLAIQTKGKDVISKKGVSNKFVLRINKKNVLIYVSLLHICF